MKYNSLVINNPDDLILGSAPLKVITLRGMLIGGGMVYAEVNFTLPTLEVCLKTLPEVKKHHAEIAEGVLARAVELLSNGLVLEMETLLEMTKTPERVIEITKVMIEAISNGKLKMDAKELMWTELLENDIREIPLDESKFVEMMLPQLEGKFIPSEYGL